MVKSKKYTELIKFYDEGIKNLKGKIKKGGDTTSRRDAIEYLKQKKSIYKKKAKKFDERTEAIKKASNRRMGTLEGNFISGKILKKPKVKIPSADPVKAVSGIANTTDKLVREVEPRELVQDNRSLFFKDEFARERRSSGWI